MKVIRAVALATIVCFTLLGGSTAVANADAGAPAAESTDPGDPGFPPDN